MASTRACAADRRSSVPRPSMTPGRGGRVSGSPSTRRTSRPKRTAASSCAAPRSTARLAGRTRATSSTTVLRRQASAIASTRPPCASSRKPRKRSKFGYGGSRTRPYLPFLPFPCLPPFAGGGLFSFGCFPACCCALSFCFAGSSACLWGASVACIGVSLFAGEEADAVGVDVDDADDDAEEEAEDDGVVGSAAGGPVPTTTSTSEPRCAWLPAGGVCLITSPAAASSLTLSDWEPRSRSASLRRPLASSTDRPT